MSGPDCSWADSASSLSHLTASLYPGGLAPYLPFLPVLPSGDRALRSQIQKQAHPSPETVPPLHTHQSLGPGPFILEPLPRDCQVPNLGDVPVPSIPNHLYPEEIRLNPAGEQMPQRGCSWDGGGRRGCIWPLIPVLQGRGLWWVVCLGMSPGALHHRLW